MEKQLQNLDELKDYIESLQQGEPSRMIFLSSQKDGERRMYIGEEYDLETLLFLAMIHDTSFAGIVTKACALVDCYNKNNLCGYAINL